MQKRICGICLDTEIPNGVSDPVFEVLEDNLGVRFREEGSLFFLTNRRKSGDVKGANNIGSSIHIIGTRTTSLTHSCLDPRVQFVLGSTIYVHDVIVRRIKDLSVYSLFCCTCSST